MLKQGPACKMRGKNGDSCWMRARPVPVVGNNQTCGDMSIRAKDHPEERARAARLFKILIGNRPGRWDAASGHMLTQGGRVILATLPASVEWGLKRQSAATVNAVNDGLMNHQ